VVRGVAYQIAGLDTGLALRERPDVAGLSGVDPVIFAVADRAAIDAWSRHLDELRIEHQAFATTQTHWLRIADGKVIEHWANRDDMGTSMQLGWGPPSPVYIVRMAPALRRARRSG